MKKSGMWIWIDREILKEVKSFAKENDISVSDIAQNCLERFIETRGKNIKHLIKM